MKNNLKNDYLNDKRKICPVCNGSGFVKGVQSVYSREGCHTRDEEITVVCPKCLGAGRVSDEKSE